MGVVIVLGLLGFLWSGFWVLLALWFAIPMLMAFIVMIVQLFDNWREPEKPQNLVKQSNQLEVHYLKDISQHHLNSLGRALKDERVSSFFTLLNTMRDMEENFGENLLEKDMGSLLITGSMTLAVAIALMREQAAKIFNVMVGKSDDGFWICVGCIATDMGNEHWHSYVHLIYAVDIENNIAEYITIPANDLHYYVDLETVVPYKDIVRVSKNLKI